MVERLLAQLGLPDKHSILFAQLVRYAITGGIITLVHLAIYSIAAAIFRIDTLIANVIAQTVSTVAGYIFHSNWSFRGHGRRDNLARTGSRFTIVAGLGFGLNSLWVWIFTYRLGGPFWWPIPAIGIVTPLIVFWLNRRWVFD